MGTDDDDEGDKSVIAAEEEVLFFHQIGTALSQWAYAENQMARLVSLCVPNHQDRSTLAIGFLSVENFRSKLTFCDNLLAHKFASSPHLDYWKTIADRLQKASVKRNKVAHHMSVFYAEGDIGRRFALVPWLDAELRPASTTPTTPERGGPAKPPSDAVCMRDLASFTHEFHQLTTALANLYELLSGRRGPFPGSPEPGGGPPPSIRSLRNPIRGALGLPYLPSRKKLPRDTDQT
jgi:hypothetical protein